MKSRKSIGRMAALASILSILSLSCSADERGNPAKDTTSQETLPVTYGSLTDSRDGKTYRTITIGNQTWMADNLNIGTRINGHVEQTNNGVIEKYAYNNNDSNANIYGGLYQWDEAMGYDTTEGVRGICPDGWHLPTDKEWKTLEMTLGMTQGDADSSEWRGTDQGTKLKEGGSSGFQALLAGGRHFDGSFIYMGSCTGFWSSAQYSASSAWQRGLYSGNTSVGRSSDDKPNGFCIRCLKD